MPRIAFIGGGNMAMAIVGGMIDSGRSSTDIVVVDPNETQRQSIANRYGVDVTDDPGVAIHDANIIVLAVEPQVFGICAPVDREDLLDAATAVSGSGPAYFFLMIEEMVRTGVALGLSPDDAKALTLQTALGAASMASNGSATPTELRRRVTSPGGTTHAAITSFEESGFGQAVENAMTACRDRALELGMG